MSSVHPKIHDIVSRIQQYVFSRRIRLKYFFEDHDTLRHYKVSRWNFERVISQATITWLQVDEVEALCDHFTDPATGMVLWKAFVDMVDSIFVTTALETTPETMVPAAGESYATGFRASAPVFGSVTIKGTELGPIATAEHNLPTSDDPVLLPLMKRLRLLVSTRGIVIKHHYQPFDKVNHGKVTYNQFLRAFPFLFFSEEERMLIADKYSDARGDVNYMALHDDVTVNTYATHPAHETSLLTVRPDHHVWEQMLMPPEQKLQAIIVMHRIRAKEYFLDYDKLRSGFVTRHQARSIFDNNYGIQIPEPDWQYLVEKYSRADGMFAWRALCEELDRAFGEKELEKSPLTRTNLPNHRTTAAARYNRPILTPVEQESLELLTNDMRRLVRNTRKNLLPIFKDLDPTNCGKVTKNMFARALCILGFELSNIQVDALALGHCDTGNVNEVNYRSFIESVDPVPEYAKSTIDGCKAAEMHRREEHEYFAKRGGVTGQADKGRLYNSLNQLIPCEDDIEFAHDPRKPPSVATQLIN